MPGASQLLTLAHTLTRVFQVAQAMSELVTALASTPQQLPFLQHLHDTLVQLNDYARKGHLLTWFHGQLRQQQLHKPTLVFA